MSTLDRYSSTIALLIVLDTFAAAALVAAAGRLPQPTLVQPTPALSSFIMVLATPVPTTVPTADTAMLQEIAEIKARVAELEAGRNSATAEIGITPEPQAVYQQMTVQEQAPSATPYVADPQIEYSAAGSTAQIEVPTDAKRLCEGFGDWRDYDARFEASPACHKAAP
jgi:hypothetical protein